MHGQRVVHLQRPVLDHVDFVSRRRVISGSLAGSPLHRRFKNAPMSACSFLPSSRATECELW